MATLGLGWLPAFAQQAMADDTQAKLSYNDNLAEQNVAAKLLIDIYSRAGVKLEVTTVPPSRAEFMSREGNSDGEVARISAYADSQPLLLKVEPSYYRIESGAFVAKGFAAPIRTKKDLAPFIVGTVRGVAHSDALVKDLPNVKAVPNSTQLYVLLNGGRIDVAIDSALNGNVLIKKMNFANIEQSASLARLELFNLLGPAKKSLAPKISKAIQTMRASGELDALTKKYEAEVIRAATAG